MSSQGFCGLGDFRVAGVSQGRQIANVTCDPMWRAFDMVLDRLPLPRSLLDLSRPRHDAPHSASSEFLRGVGGRGKCRKGPPSRHVGGCPSDTCEAGHDKDRILEERSPSTHDRRGPSKQHALLFVAQPTSRDGSFVSCRVDIPRSG